MAQYGITHSCGHTATHQIYGTNSHGERERKAAWLESRDCTDCWKAQQERERAEASAKAAETTADLAPLTGSQKQIAWATTIRAKFVEAAKNLNDRTNNSSRRTGQLWLTDRILEHTEARWWIDYRDYDVKELMNLQLKDTPYTPDVIHAAYNAGRDQLDAKYDAARIPEGIIDRFRYDLTAREQYAIQHNDRLLADHLRAVADLHTRRVAALAEAEGVPVADIARRYGNPTLAS